MHNMDDLEPDWDFAAKHGKACAPGIAQSSPSNQRIEEASSQRQIVNPICECCLNIINKQPVPLCENSKELQFLGFGFPLYFVFLKYAIILLVLQIASSNALSIYWGYQSTYGLCFNDEQRTLPGSAEVVGDCTSSLILFLRAQTVITTEEIILRFSSFFVQLFALIYIRDTLRKTNNYYKESFTSLPTYSLLLSDLPRQPGLARKIRGFLEQTPTTTIHIEDLILLNEMQGFTHSLEAKQHLIQQKRSLLQQNESPQRETALREISSLIEQKNREIKREHLKELHLLERDEVICEKAIVVLQNQKMKNWLHEHLKKDHRGQLQEWFGNTAEQISVKTAPSPKEIIWENINLSHRKRILRSIMGWSLTAAACVIVTGMFYGILYVKGREVEKALSEVKSNPDEADTLYNQTLVISIFTMVAVIFFNKFLFSYLLHWFTHLEKHPTAGDEEYSFCLKYTIGLFFTTAVMTFLVEDLTFNNVYKEKEGVVQQESIMFFLDSFLVPLIWFVNPWYLFHTLKRKYYYGRKDITQRQANELMEDAKYSMGKKYAEVLDSIWFAYLYSSLIPVGNILVTMGTCIFYWVDKYNLLRKSSINEHISSSLSLHAVTFLDLTLLFRSAGELIFDSQIREGICWQSLVCLCLGALYVLLPTNSLLSCLHEEKFKTKDTPYADIRNSFTENYRSLHPLFRTETTQFLQKIDLTAPDTHTALHPPSPQLQLQLQLSHP